jgi:hypothetical protein
MNMVNISNTMTINDFKMPIFTGVILPAWIKMAEAKGFLFVGRVIDRLHFALRCVRCGAMNKVKRYTLMSAKPSCGHCIEQVWANDAASAGLTFLHRDPANRHYGVYRARCGHEYVRQFELIKRVAKGKIKIRCELCQPQIEAAEATEREWDLIGADPEGDASYRYYRHTECGFEQRMARANMKTGRHSCGGCGVEWPAAPSFLYVMRFTMENGRELVKFGYSKDPDSRLKYQLRRDPEMPCSILRVLAVPTGHAAIIAEKRIHAELRYYHPAAIVDPSVFAAHIRVKSEIYDGSLTQIIFDHLTEVERSMMACAS